MPHAHVTLFIATGMYLGCVCQLYLKNNNDDKHMIIE